MSRTCHGNVPEHCCWIEGEVCQFLEEDTVPGRHWVCGLRRELGDWALVHADPRYQPIHEVWARLGTSDCGDFRGAIQPDGSTVGQCCYWGHIFGPGE
jgi:hypothetical protein